MMGIPWHPGKAAKKALNAAVMIFAVAICLSLFVLSTPKPTAFGDRFSSIRALAHVEAIAREPHSVFDPAAHERARQYVKDILTNYLGSANVREYV